MDETKLNEFIIAIREKLGSQDHLNILTENDINLLIGEVQDAIAAPNKTSLQKRRVKRFKVKKVNNCLKLFQFDKVNNSFPVISIENIYSVLKLTHQNTGHGGRDRMRFALKNQYGNITVTMIQTFINLCEVCSAKKCHKTSGIVEKPIVPKKMNEHAQMDLIDIRNQPDGDFKFILVYQDLLTKFVRLRSLKTKSAKEVALNLIQIFSETCAPKVLQTDNGREFRNELVEDILKIFSSVEFVSLYLFLNTFI